MLSLGLGLPLFVLALFSGQLQRLPAAGEWMIWVRKLMGWVLVGMAAYFIRPILPDAVKVVLVSGVALAAGIHLGWMEKSQAGFRALRWLRTFVGVAGIVLAAFWISSWAMQGPGVSWQPYSEELLAQSREQGKPVIIDFYAAWCTPCRELESITFHHPAVVQQAEGGFTMVKVDLTQGGNPLHERLLEHYDVKGVPTVVFIDAGGKVRKDLRLVDFLPSEPFLSLMSQVERGSRP